VDPTHGQTPLPFGHDLEVVKSRADAICTRPTSKEVKKYGEEKRREKNRRKECQFDYFPPVPSSKTL